MVLYHVEWKLTKPSDYFTSEIHIPVENTEIRAKKNASHIEMQFALVEEFKILEYPPCYFKIQKYFRI